MISGDEGLNSQIKKHWQIGIIFIAAVSGYTDLTLFKSRYEHAHIELEHRVEVIEKNGVPPVRERLQSEESHITFLEERLRILEMDEKQNQTLFGELRSKLDVMGTQVSSIADWVKFQQRKDK